MEISRECNRKLSVGPTKKLVWMGSTSKWPITLPGLRKTASSIVEKVSVLIRRTFVEDAGGKQLNQDICASLKLRSLQFYDTAQT